MGVDPGTVITGYAVIRREATRCHAVDYGNIRPPSKEKLSQRYALIYQGVDHLLRQYRPNGRASKQQVQGMVTHLLGLASVPESEDTADALAIALCHAQACDYQHLIGDIL